MKRLFPLLFLAFATLMSARVAQSQECGDVSIAKMHWQSAALLAEIDKLILSYGYGCNVTLVAGDTIPTFRTMNENGMPDVAPEMWINSVREQLDAAVDEGRLFYGARSLTDGGVEGWWIPGFVADAHPEITSISDALKHPELFPDPDDPSKGAVYSCPPAWSCRISTGNLFKAYKAEERGFKLVETGTAAELRDSVVRSFDNNTGWLGYYWAPTALLGQYRMVRLSFGVPHNKVEWDTCTVIPDCKDPKPNGWPNSLVYTVVTKSFRESAPDAFSYLARRSWDNRTVNHMLAWMLEGKATPEEAARHFMEVEDEIWMQWVTLDAANRIGEALDGSN